MQETKGNKKEKLTKKTRRVKTVKLITTKVERKENSTQTVTSSSVLYSKIIRRANVNINMLRRYTLCHPHLMYVQYYVMSDIVQK